MNNIDCPVYDLSCEVRDCEECPIYYECMEDEEDE